MPKSGPVYVEKSWKLLSEPNPLLVESLSEELKLDSILASLLVQRGIKDFYEARSFFRPQLEGLHNPFLMKDMDKAVIRVKEAIDNQEKVLVYGDYDVDGTTSVALMYSFLRDRIQDIGYYIPDRYSEGYGISYSGISFAEENGYTLIIALDCGIKAVEKIKFASTKGIDFVVCDHHTPGDELPEAVAILDPKRGDCEYPYKDLSGCGVGFKLIQAYSLRNGIPFSTIGALLDLVAVSIASDLVPMTGENKILAYHGLLKMNSDPVPGLKGLMQVANVGVKPVTISDIVFKLGPRINAAGRISSAASSVELLICDNPTDAQILGEKINSVNDHRKSIDGDITAKAMEMVEEQDKIRIKKTTVLYKPDWVMGVVGIVASRLIEHFYRPTVVLTRSNGMATGSARSVDGYDIYNAINSCSDLLESFGGHKYAAGLSLPVENIEKFTERFEAYVASTITEDQMKPQISVDREILLLEITPKFFRILKQFEPFGPENLAPVFVARNVCDTGKSRQVGRGWEHLKLSVTDSDTGISEVEAIAFNKGQLFNEIHKGKPFDLCFSIEENVFRGVTSIQLMVKDIKFI